MSKAPTEEAVFRDAAVHRLVKKALAWLPAEFDAKDGAFVERELKRVKSEFKEIQRSGDAPWLRDFLTSGKTTRIWADRTPRYLKDAVVLDLSACYRKRFETMGREVGRCAALRSLFRDPFAWFVRYGEIKYAHKKTGKKLGKLLDDATKVFGSDTSAGALGVGRRKRSKKFYTRFYGSCTPKKTDKEAGIMKNIGLLARLQNTLHVVRQEVSLRANRTNHGIVMIQTDSFIISAGGLANHHLYGVAAYRASLPSSASSSSSASSASSASSESWADWLARMLSEPGVAEWRVDATPQSAIFPGVVNKYAFLNPPTVVDADADADAVGGGWAIVDTSMKYIPRTMLTKELRDAGEFSSEKAKFLLKEALVRGPSEFGRILRAIPNVIKYGKRNQKPTLRAFLEPFVKGSSCSSSSSASSSWSQPSSSRFQRTPFERAIALAKSKDSHHFVVGREVNASGARSFDVVKKMSDLPSRGAYHEYFTGAVRAFAEYDPDKLNPQPLPEGALAGMCASLVSFFSARMCIEVEARALEMKRPDKEQHRHIVFEVIHVETGSECLFWDPKDIPEALGTHAKLFDPAPWHHRKSLRLPGSKKFDGASAYEPVNGDNLRDPSVYSKYCVSVAPTEGVLFWGTLPKVELSGDAAHNDLFFPSEQYMCALVIRLARHLVGGKYDVTVERCELSAQVREANCVWQRVRMRCVDARSRNTGKLLDLGVFCDKFLKPWLCGKKTAVLHKLTHHGSNNSYVLWRFDGEKGVLGSVEFKCFNRQGRQGSGNDLWDRTRVKLDSAFVARAAEEMKLVSNEYSELVRGEIQQLYELPTLGDNKVFAVKSRCDAHNLREAIRHRLRARRNYKFLDKEKQKRGAQTKRDQERVGRLTSSKKTWDSRFSFSAAVAYAALHAPRVLAEKVAEKEYQLVVAKSPSYKRHAPEYLARIGNLRTTPAKTNKTLRAWLMVVY